MRTRRDGKPKQRLFSNLPLRVYKGLEIAARQNFCTKTTYVVRALLMALDRDGISITDIKDD